MVKTIALAENDRLHNQHFARKVLSSTHVVNHVVRLRQINLCIDRCGICLTGIDPHRHCSGQAHDEITNSKSASPHNSRNKRHYCVPWNNRMSQSLLQNFLLDLGSCLV